MRMTAAAAIATLVVATGLTTPDATAADPDGAGPGALFTFPDARQDAVLYPDYVDGPAFTHRIDPQAGDIRKVGVSVTETMVYVRVQLSDLYGAVRAFHRQEGEQTVVVDLFDAQGAPLAAATVNWYVDREPRYYVGEGSLPDDRCDERSTFTASPRDNYVLLRIPTSCTTSPDEATFHDITVSTLNRVRQRDARGAQLSSRAYSDRATWPGVR